MPYYTDYVRHMMRLYTTASMSQEAERSAADSRNIDLCEDVMKYIREPERSAILAVYRQRNIKKGVRAAACQFGMPEERLWRIVCQTEKIIARERGLI